MERNELSVEVKSISAGIVIIAAGVAVIYGSGYGLIVIGSVLVLSGGYVWLMKRKQQKRDS